MRLNLSTHINEHIEGPIFRHCVTGSRGRPLLIKPFGHTYTPRTPETVADAAAVERAQLKRDRKAARNLSLVAER